MSKIVIPSLLCKFVPLLLLVEARQTILDDITIPAPTVKVNKILVKMGTIIRIIYLVYVLNALARMSVYTSKLLSHALFFFFEVSQERAFMAFSCHVSR